MCFNVCVISCLLRWVWLKKSEPRGKTMAVDAPNSPCSEHDGWELVAKDFLLSSQEDSDQTLEAEACKSESHSKCTTSSGNDESHMDTKVPGDLPSPQRLSGFILRCMRFPAKTVLIE